MANYTQEVSDLATQLTSAIANLVSVKYPRTTVDLYNNAPTAPAITPVDLIAPTMGATSIDSLNIALPSAPETPSGWSDIPVTPTMTPIPLITTPAPVTLPTSNLSAPTVTLPTLPIAPDATLPVLGVLESVSRPSKAVLDVISAPTLQQIVVPSPPALTLPVWAEIEPIPPNLAIPANALANFTPPHARVWTGGDWIDDAIQVAGTGLPPTIEEQIWDREEERARLALLEATRKLKATMAAKGYSMPPGKLTSAQLKLEQEYVTNRATSSRDIAVKQAELTQNNQQFKVTSGINWEKAQMDFAANYGQLLLTIAKETISAAIQIANLEIDLYKSSVQTYLVKAQVFAELIKAEATKTEIYRAQLEGVKAQTEVQTAQVEIYKARIAANEALVRAYQVEVQAYSSELEAQRTQVEIYKAQVEGIGAAVRIYESKVNAANAVAKIEETKLNVFAAQATAFSKQLEAAAEQTKANAAYVQSQGAVASATAEANKVLIAYYQALTETGKVQNDAVLKAFEAELQLFGAELEAQLKQATISLEREKVAANMNLAAFNGQVDLEKAKALIGIENSKLISSAYEHDAEVAVKRSELFLKSVEVDAMNAKNGTDTELKKFGIIADLIKESLSAYGNIAIAKDTR